MKICKEPISKEEFLKAIRDGVSHAILTMTESGDGHSGPIIREPILQAIKEGVYQAISEMTDFERLKDRLQ